MAGLVWFITGCSSGFGEQFVHSILARRDKVIATARNVDKIKHLEDVGAAVLPLDITASPKDILSTVEKAIAIHGHIDVLVNNAAFVSIGLVEDLSSLSGWIGHPGVSAYASSKFALEGIAEAVRHETSGFNIRTLLIEPGRFRTKLLSSQNMKAVASGIDDYADFSKMLLSGIAAEDNAQPGDPKKLIELIVDLVRREGAAEGKEVPFRLPVGSDCYNEIKAKCDEMLAVMDTWKDVILSTDYAD